MKHYDTTRLRKKIVSSFGEEILKSMVFTGNFEKVELVDQRVGCNGDELLQSARRVVDGCELPRNVWIRNEPTWRARGDRRREPSRRNLERIDTCRIPGMNVGIAIGSLRYNLAWLVSKGARQ